MRAKVVTSTCDRCHVEEHRELPRNYSPERNRLLLPEGWLHVSGITSVAVEFTMDLCGDCKKAVLAAAGAANTHRPNAAASRWAS